MSAPARDWLRVGGAVEVVNLRVDFPPEMLTALEWTLSAQFTRAVTAHLDAWVALRILHKDVRRVPVEMHIGVPVGFSIATGSAEVLPLRSTDPNAPVIATPIYPYERERWVGWNVGASWSTQFFVAERLGLSLELGWRRAQLFNRITVAVDVDSSRNTWAGVKSTSDYALLNVGVVVLM